MVKIAIHPVVLRQTASSPFSYFDGEFEIVRKLTIIHFYKAVKGYREGVLLVPVPPNGFFTSIVQLQEGDHLEGIFQPRYPGEEPRKSMWSIHGQKSPAQTVKIVIYSKATLAEDDDVSDPDADYEIVSINASLTEEDVPLTVETLIANHFHFDGGTQTQMTNDEFVDTLEKSVKFWRNKMMYKPFTVKL